MTEQPTNLLLSMASMPAHTTDTAQIRRAKFQVSSYKAMRFMQRVASLILVLCLSVGAYYVITNFFLKSVKISGSSMVPTLQENNSYLLNVWALRNRDPQRNEIVVIRDPGDHGFSVKRVIAVGGQTIHFKDGQVYVDDKKLTEPYVLGHRHTFTYSKAKEQIITCGKNEFFVMGDNRFVSVDSRSYGPVSRMDVLGLVELR